MAHGKCKVTEINVLSCASLSSKNSVQHQLSRDTCVCNTDLNGSHVVSEYSVQNVKKFKTCSEIIQQADSVKLVYFFPYMNQYTMLSICVIWLCFKGHDMCLSIV